jgi:hypothetical protein
VLNSCLYTDLVHCGKCYVLQVCVVNVSPVIVVFMTMNLAPRECKRIGKVYSNPISVLYDFVNVIGFVVYLVQMQIYYNILYNFHRAFSIHCL